jgi:hypothetical protein
VTLGSARDSLDIIYGHEKLIDKKIELSTSQKIIVQILKIQILHEFEVQMKEKGGS